MAPMTRRLILCVFPSPVILDQCWTLLFYFENIQSLFFGMWRPLDQPLHLEALPCKLGLDFRNEKRH